MNFAWFTPESKTFAMQVPKEWELEMSGDTYVWFDPREWKGNFRLTVYIWGGEPGSFVPSAFLDEEYRDNPGAERKRYGEFEAVTYLKHATDADDRISVFYFSLVKNTYIFAFSFTVMEADETSEETKQELEKIDILLRSLKLHAAGRG
jgi:hypothetical protein